MTKNQKKLLLLAAIALAEKKPKIRMEFYRSGEIDGLSIDQDKQKHPCGTAGCFLGWMPFLGVRGLGFSPKDYDGWDNTFSFMNYCIRIFGEEFYLSDEWVWLFGPYWPNRHDSVLKRVRYFVVYEDRPDWFKQRNEFADFETGNIYNAPENWKAPTLEEAKKAVGLE